MNKNKSDISENVINQIKSGHIKMRSRIFYTALSALVVIVSLFVSFVSGYISRIFVLWAKIANSQSLAIGARMNLAQTIEQFPWILTLIFIVLVAGLVYLMKQYKDIYGKKIRLIIIIAVIFAIFIGIILFNFGLFDGFVNYSNHGGLQMQNRWK